MTEEYKDIPDPIRKWGLLILGGIVVLCLLALVGIFVARKQLATALIRVLATETLTSTATLPETATFTQSSTDTATSEPVALGDSSEHSKSHTCDGDHDPDSMGPPLLDEKVRG